MRRARSGKQEGRRGGREEKRGESLLKTLVYNSAIRDQYLSRLADDPSPPPAPLRFVLASSTLDQSFH